MRIHGRNHIWLGGKTMAKPRSSRISLSSGIGFRSKKRGGATFVAFDALHFDVPFNAERCKILGLVNAEQVWGSLVHYPVYLDLHQLLDRSRDLLVGLSVDQRGVSGSGLGMD